MRTSGIELKFLYMCVDIQELIGFCPQRIYSLRQCILRHIQSSFIFYFKNPINYILFTTTKTEWSDEAIERCFINCLPLHKNVNLNGKSLTWRNFMFSFLWIYKQFHAPSFYHWCIPEPYKMFLVYLEWLALHLDTC